MGADASDGQNGNASFDVEQLAAQLFDGVKAQLPPSWRVQGGLLAADAQQALRDAIAQAVARLDLVTSEQFELQNAVLLRTRERLEAAERRISQLEERLGIKD